MTVNKPDIRSDDRLDSKILGVEMKHHNKFMNSYAQNFEDVVLNRLFREQASGFYIDVGAFDPNSMSVTRHFYDRGWSGINIEPIPECFQKFVNQRPRDININVALGSRKGSATLYCMDKHEFSTFDPDVAKEYLKQGDAKMSEIATSVSTLADICEEHCSGEIDFLKIDVEGWEGEVLAGGDWQRFRPRMIVVEATKPRTNCIDWKDVDQLATWSTWEKTLLIQGYQRVYFDGLNCFYLREEDSQYESLFNVPVTIMNDVFVPPRERARVAHANQLVEKKDREIKLLRRLLEEARSECADRSSPVRINPKSFAKYGYAQKSHWRILSEYSERLYGTTVDMNDTVLKSYQDLLVYKFILDNIPPGSRILDVGGGDSRILKHFAAEYECWNIDKLEGCGNGPKQLNNTSYRLVRDYMGNFNKELPDAYFDFVFSISALEHVPRDEKIYDDIVADIERVLKPGGLSLHLIDVVIKNGVYSGHPIVDYFIRKVNLCHRIDVYDTEIDEDLYHMSENIYTNTWYKLTKIPFNHFGRPTSINLLWEK